MVVAHVEPILLIQQPSQTESKTDKPKLANRFSATSNVETKPTAPLLQFSGPMKVASTRPVQPARPPAPRPSIPQLFLPPVAPTIRKPLASLPNPPVVRKCQNGSSDPSPSKRLPQDHLATKRPLPHSKSNSSPKKRLRLAIAESESSSSSSSDDSDIDGPTLVETDWLSSLAPHQQRLYAVLLEVSSRLVRHVTDREDVLVELGEAYRRDGLDVVAAMRAEQDAAIQQYAGAVGEARRRAAEVLEDTLAQVKEEVLALGAGGVENDGKARNAVTELVEKYA
ncbi:hypothetical protein K461DRAFT_281085 [Myriangium duriaei CBS 260.36]|uniref:Uncharacterized protein n=1 Tax=Myriangium duriaei CBS 260.36 TaxID=1168546 RepID=A0A9P4ITS4_9PEZI|nr:hypothetical protein K461DRAFT_281085 [Myriangium duriaei CBS 260.36]